MRIGVEAGLLLREHYTGIEVRLAELVARMPRLGKDHEFLLCFNYNRSRHRRTVERLAAGRVQTRVCRIPPQVLGPLHRHLAVPTEWIYGPVDVMLYPHFTLLPQRRGRRVLTVHDVFPMTHPELYPPKDVGYCRTFVSPAISRADAVIAVSNYTGVAVQERFGIPKPRIHCVPNGVDERFRPPEDHQAATAVATRYGIHGPYFLFVGTAEPRKNLVRLVEAFGRAKSGPVREHTLVLAGKAGWGDAALRSAIARLDSAVRIFQPGYVAAEDLPALYGAATAFLFPSLVEGFGIPPLEAMACGCPVLASAAPALDEVVGDAGLLVDPWDVESIAEGIRRLGEEDELRETLKARGLRRAKEFSWDRTTAETLAVLEAT